MLKNLKFIIDKVIEKSTEVSCFIFKYRYYIAVTIFILCIIFQISGSSIGEWKNFVASNITSEGVLLGESRTIRSDEWAVLTPMTFSQKFDGFNYFSNLIRGEKTDVFMIYALPVLNVMQIFRPFQLGYLFIGNAGGLSFFWCGRLIALFLVSFELAMILTKKSKLLSFIYAILVTLSPNIQWWFAVNGIAEIFIFGQFALILLYKYITNNELKKRCLYLIGIVISAGGYILVLYPAWQIPMFYVFLVLAIWIIIDKRKEIKINYKDIIAIVVAIAVLTGCMIYIFSQSLETIKSVTNTVYPGSRNETGGGMWRFYFDYLINIFSPFKNSNLNPNACEKASMFSLFPMGIIISLVAMIKHKKKDLNLILLYIVYVFLNIYCLIGFPDILAKITLLSVTTPKRAMIATGFLDILILIRGLAIIDKPISKIPALIVASVITITLVPLSKRYNSEYIRTEMAISMLIMCIYLFYFALRYKAKYCKYLFTVGITFVMIMCGATINPIRRGIDVIYQSEIIKEVQKINEDESGKWLVEELGFPIPNYILMAGVPVINSTNTYPHINKWKKIDKDSEYEDVYNRYAHIGIKLRKDEKEFSNKFELISPDSFDVYLIPEELKVLDVKYIFTISDLEKLSSNSISFEKIFDYNGYKIYKIK